MDWWAEAGMRKSLGEWNSKCLGVVDGFFVLELFLALCCLGGCCWQVLGCALNI
jgi:hypothetical protein